MRSRVHSALEELAYARDAAPDARPHRVLACRGEACDHGDLLLLEEAQDDGAPVRLVQREYGLDHHAAQLRTLDGLAGRLDGGRGRHGDLASDTRGLAARVRAHD